jgi:ABC-type multidrug transport system fused ATPase/permease subunit
LELCGNAIILFAAVFAVLGRDHLNASVVGLSVSYALSVTQTLNWLVRMTSEMETNIVSVERILEYCDIPTEAEWFSDDRNKPAPEWPQHGAIDFSDYSTRYRSGLDLVLENIKTHVKPGEKVYLCNDIM